MPIAWSVRDRESLRFALAVTERHTPDVYAGLRELAIKLAALFPELDVVERPARYADSAQRGLFDDEPGTT